MTEKICAACGAAFVGRGVRYCNRRCMAEGFKKETITLDASRKRANKHIGPACEVCSGTKRLAVHHKDEDPFNNDVENLMTLCVVCHNRHHWGIVRLGHGPPFDPSLRVKNPPITECVHGHAYTEENTYVRPDGYRDCRICLRERNRRSYWRAKERAA